MILHTSAWKNKALLFRVSFGHRGNCQLHSQLSFFFFFFLGRVYLDISHISNSNIGRCGIVSVGTIWCVTPHLDHEMIHLIDSSSASYKTRFSWRIYISSRFSTNKFIYHSYLFFSCIMINMYNWWFQLLAPTVWLSEKFQKKYSLLLRDNMLSNFGKLIIRFN